MVIHPIISTAQEAETGGWIPYDQEFEASVCKITRACLETDQKTQNTTQWLNAFLEDGSDKVIKRLTKYRKETGEGCSLEGTQR